MPGFVFLTLLSNCAQVVMVPLLAGRLWWIKASGKYIGEQYKNRRWDNLLMRVLFILSLWGGDGAVKSVYQMLVSEVVEQEESQGIRFNGIRCTAG